VTERFGQKKITQAMTTTNPLKTELRSDTASAETGRDPAKLQQILEGARKVFFADGFDGASMNDIAKAAGVSKGTLYVYFESKQALFVTLIREDHAQQAERVCNPGIQTDNVPETLTRLGNSLMSRMCDPASLAHLRVVLAVSAKFPEVGRAFYDAGPRFGTDRLALYLGQQVQAGRLANVDPHTAATTFIMLCQGDLFKRMLFRETEIATPAEIEACVSAAVGYFMRLFGPDATAGG
jgi:AcrR family transcriptional regulator